MKNLNLHLIFAAGMLLLFSACAKTKTLTFVLEDVPMTAEGPLYEGANTVQGQSGEALEKFLKENGSSMEALSSARLTKASLQVADSLNFDLINQVTLQLASDSAPMPKVGFLNPVNKGQKNIILQVAQEQEGIAEILKQKNFTIVLDANVVADTSANLNYTADLEFTLEVNE